VRKLSRSIVNTISYAERYGGRLTEDQLYFRLLSREKYGRKEVKKNLEKLGIKFPKKVSNRESILKLELARELVSKHLVKFPSIIFSGITGSVAARNAKKNEDIDLILVCKEGTMWITRFKLWLYIKLKHIPHRKYGQKEGRDEFCFNLWLEEDEVKMPLLKQNQKNAVDLILTEPILDRGGVYQKIISKNSWVKKYVVNGYLKRLGQYKKPIGGEKAGVVTKFLNEVAFWGQIIFIRLKGPISFIDKHRAFFHETKKV
jgi:hypothetical protein